MLEIIPDAAQLAKLHDIMNGKRVHSAMVKGMKRGMLWLQGEVPGYPPPPPNSTYQRTGTLGRRTNSGVDEAPFEIVGWIGNSTEYAPWVISRDETDYGGPQASIHAGRWYTLQSVAEDNTDAVSDIVLDYVMDVFE